MKIQDLELTQEHIGRGVVYVPRHGEREDGTLVRWDDRYVFVRYRGVVKATSPGDLEWLRAW